MGSNQLAKAIWSSAMLGAAVIIACQARLALPQSGSPAKPASKQERTYPSFPGALREVPDWMARDAPFDVRRWLRQVPPDENAATLYFDALYEFDPQAGADCVSPEENQSRGAALRERYARTEQFLQRPPSGTLPAQRLQVVDEYRESFEKLARAQPRRQCAFETPIGLETALYLSVRRPFYLRRIARLLDWRVESEIDEGQVDAAVDSFTMVLHLSRDFQRRGPLVHQFVSLAIVGLSQTQVLPRILGSDELAPRHCDRLIEALSQYTTPDLDPLAEGFRVEYLSLRDLLRRLEANERLSETFGWPGSTNGVALAKLMLEEGGLARPGVAEEIDDALSRMTPADYKAELEQLNRFFGPLVKPERPWSELQDLDADQESAANKLFLEPLLPDVRLIVNNFFLRHRTRIGAMQCLVALRRWQTEHDGEPPANLLMACKAAGLKSVPIDPFSRAGEALRFTMLADEPVVYSVARDGKDDGAQLDWNFESGGQVNGDWIFRLPPVVK